MKWLRWTINVIFGVLFYLAFRYAFKSPDWFAWGMAFVSYFYATLHDDSWRIFDRINIK